MQETKLSLQRSAYVIYVNDKFAKTFHIRLRFHYHSQAKTTADVQCYDRKLLFSETFDSFSVIIINFSYSALHRISLKFFFS